MLNTLANSSMLTSPSLFLSADAYSRSTCRTVPLDVPSSSSAAAASDVSCSYFSRAMLPRLLIFGLPQQPPILPSTKHTTRAPVANRSYNLSISERQ